MKKEMTYTELAKETAILTAAVAIIAAAVYFFLVPSHASVSSISGLGIVLSNFIPLPLSAITMILNVVLLIIGFFTCGKEFGVKTVYTSVALPVFLGIFERMFPDYESLTGSQELDVLCYILVVSVGLSILFNRNASSGGLDIVAKIMNKYLHMELGKAMSLSGMCVALSAALVYDKKTVVLSILGTYFNGIVLDLGVSSYQLDTPERGFTYREDAPLDMRMDPTRGQSAAEWLQTAEEDDIAWVIKTFGEERFGKRIARAIVERNRIQPMTRTKELAEVIAAAMPVKDKHKHPATRTFQAVRIWVNSELEEIEQALKSSLNVLAPGGRLSIISFHSLEDRIVKRFMRENSRGPQVPAGLPMTEEQLKKLGGRQLRALGKLMPGEEEVAENPRARSSVLRIAERTNA